ncbi:CAP domain-containing protein [Cryptosporangium sp. NPDC048952]|uniref:CAP domain-containing protein n=1 Tax=Cryptosporangium sp. NPDC048952 TaxID=3363961 RepID=UPI003717EB37
MFGSTYGNHASRPDIYSGSRRRFTGIGTIAAGFVALVLVLGALLTSELGRYGTSDSAPDSQATDPQAPVLTPGAPNDVPSADPAAPLAPAAPGGTPDGARPSASSTAPAGNATNRAVLATVNKSLTKLGCDEVAYSPTLQKASATHLTAMVTSGYLTLVGPNGDDPGKRARAAGYERNVLEAIVLGAETPNEAAATGFSKSTDATVRTQATGSLKCGYRSLGADMRRDSRNVPITVIFLGK